MFKIQTVFSVAFFLILYVVMPNGFKVSEGIKGVLLVLGITILLRLIPANMLSFDKYLAPDSNAKSIRPVMLVFNVMKHVTIVLFIISLCLSGLALVGMLVSDVTVTTFYVLALVTPMWLSIRESIVNFVKNDNISFE